jgi:DNA-binding response OmpR family regulator
MKNGNSDLNVLVVDDEPLIRKLVIDILGDEGFHVDEAENSDACMDVLGKRRIDIILMDIQMPGTDGMTTLKRLAEENYGVDVIMISGHGTIETAVEAVRFGAHDFIEKPFSIEKLKSAVKAVAKKRQQSGQVEKIRDDKESIGDYIIEEKIATGATSTVYRAIKKNLDKPVALKVLHSHIIEEAGDFLRRFEQEAKVTAALGHPNIVQVFDFGKDKGMFFMAMELVSGTPLKTWISKGHKFPYGIAASITIKVASALEHAHEKGIVHRDIKPSNVIIGEKGTVKLVDFGISRCLDAETAVLTQPDQMVGTPLFMSPEQISGKKAGTESDLFSLGTLLYLLVTMHYPFNGPNIGSIVRAISEGTFREPHALDDNISHDLNRLIVKCLQKSPARRYGRAADLKKDLEEAVRFDVGLNIDRALEDYFVKVYRSIR